MLLENGPRKELLMMADTSACINRNGHLNRICWRHRGGMVSDRTKSFYKGCRTPELKESNSVRKWDTCFFHSGGQEAGRDDCSQIAGT